MFPNNVRFYIGLLMRSMIAFRTFEQWIFTAFEFNMASERFSVDVTPVASSADVELLVTDDRPFEYTGRLRLNETT